ncbi:hypothetical protein [Legionella tunisiensis]|uniref:hypothetical protein n=1 Tax=Legionella tunisiensis TaxID=1034944 RepID=UPI00031B0BF1|nr:hypothetical protein [Legionella tunisiensis]
MLVLLIPALYWQNLRLIFKPLLFAILAYFLARFLIVLSLHDIPGQLMEWYFRGSSYTYFEVNLLWLFNEQHIFYLYFVLRGYHYFGLLFMILFLCNIDPSAILAFVIFLVYYWLVVLWKQGFLVKL